MATGLKICSLRKGKNRLTRLIPQGLASEAPNSDCIRAITKDAKSIGETRGRRVLVQLVAKFMHFA